jgi:hypothetical protein
MKIVATFAFLAIGFISAVASDPPGYARALIGHVISVLPEGVLVDSLPQNQLTPEPAPGVDHECFVGGTVLVHGLRTSYQVGNKIEIMVTLSDDTRVITLDPAHPLQVNICNVLSESLAFPVGVNWNP